MNLAQFTASLSPLLWVEFNNNYYYLIRIAKIGCASNIVFMQPSPDIRLPRHCSLLPTL